ncbi:MAG: 4-(cytidine 5'-diphospho)-2-C-methyl-D-erythritol kinase [Solirubrobacteraceae bacterium]|jgi:4-diphosphocytidyl-2-C-methyl-D-erythritol kinase
MSVHRVLAPAKVNLGLFLGPTRDSDHRHELVTVMQSISLADELTLTAAPAGVVEDEVLCPGLAGPPGANLAAAALKAFRVRTGWDAPPLRLQIDKRIPVAGGLGGGSADAAATLRLARHASGLGDEELLLELAAGLGADVPAQVSPGCWLASGAGERLQALAEPSPSFAVLVLALDAELSTAAVYAEADRLGLGRAPTALEDRRRALLHAWRAPAPGQTPPLGQGRELLHNDLEPAAVSLCPQIADVLAQARRAGAELALVSGSGPTVIGLGGAGPAAERLRGRVPGPICATPVGAAFARAVTLASEGS